MTDSYKEIYEMLGNRLTGSMDTFQSRLMSAPENNFPLTRQTVPGYNEYMPRNANSLIKSARYDIDKELEEAEEYRQSLLLKPVIPDRKRSTALELCMKEIYRIFVDHAAATGTNEPITGLADKLMKKYARNTVYRARDLLQIRYERRDRKWWWYFPEAAPEEALVNYQRDKIKEMAPITPRTRKLKQKSVRALCQFLKQNGYEIVAKRAYTELGYSRSAVQKAKSILALPHRTIDHILRWYWPAPEVQDWLIAKLSKGPVPRVRLEDMAHEEHEWTSTLLRFTKIALPQVEYTNVKGVPCWWDPANQHVELPAEELMELPEDDNDITVDFGGDDE